MSFESWLDGFDQKKNDLLAWCEQGGDAVEGARKEVFALEQALRDVRNKVQADAALADLARMDEMEHAAPPVTPEPEPLPLPTPEPAPLPQPAAAAPVVPVAPEPVPAPEPVAAEAAPRTAAEGILKSLAWMDGQSDPAPAPEAPGRGKTTARPAVLEMFGSAPAPEAPAAPTPPPPAPFEAAPVMPEPAAPAVTAALETALPEPAPAAPVTPSPAPSAVPTMDSILDSVLPDPLAAATEAPAPSAAPVPAPAPSLEDTTPIEPPPAPSESSYYEPHPVKIETAPAVEQKPAPTSDFLDLSPTPSPEAPAPVAEPPLEPKPAPVFEEPEPAPAPAPKKPRRKPILVERPDGETRRAALAGVGAGPNPPFLLHAVIEVPRGGGAAYVYNDPDDVFIHIDHPGSESYPALSHVAYGFIPETVSDDGAHLDAFIVSTGASGPGEMMRVRALGYLHRSDGDHKLFCVPEKHSAKAMVDVPKPILEACEQWKVPASGSPGTWMDGSQARDLVRRCID